MRKKRLVMYMSTRKYLAYWALFILLFVTSLPWLVLSLPDLPVDHPAVGAIFVTGVLGPLVSILGIFLLVWDENPFTFEDIPESL